MEKENSISDEEGLKQAILRLCIVSSFTTELLEVRAENPLCHVLFIPGNPGVVSFYKEFVEAVFERMGGCATVTAVGHISHTRKNWECGQLFSLQDQIDHKVEFIKQELQNAKIPLLLVGHSIGSYISLEILRRFPDQVTYCIGLYPFLSLNKESTEQTVIEKIAASKILCVMLSTIIAVLGLFPNWATAFIVRRSFGNTWSSTAVEAVCSHLLKYHTMRNVLFMAMSEFAKLPEAPDWTFLGEKVEQVAFLFGVDDHWGPLSTADEIFEQVMDVTLSIEREGLTHVFACTKAGSIWVADHVVKLLKSKLLSQSVRLDS